MKHLFWQKEIPIWNLQLKLNHLFSEQEVRIVKSKHRQNCSFPAKLLVEDAESVSSRLLMVGIRFFDRNECCFCIEIEFV